MQKNNINKLKMHRLNCQFEEEKFNLCFKRELNKTI